MQRSMVIEYGDDTLAALGLSPAEFLQEARFLLAAKLYEIGRLASGQAARFCGLERVDFLLALPRVGVAVSNLSAEDAEAEIAFAAHG
jgi:hypothetical protein